MSGNDLANDIETRIVPADACIIWWLGQHSFVIKSGTTILYLDPFLSQLDGRLVPPLLDAGRVNHATLIFGSHDHLDHIDRAIWPSLAAASPDAKFVIPELLREQLSESLNIPMDRFIGVDDATRITHGEVRVTGVAASHEFFDRDPATGRYPYLGFVIEIGGLTLYHAGDTVAYDGLLARLKRWKFDAMFVPINGRDAKRYKLGIIGNMTYQEAADLAGACQPRVVIPTHYEMFAMNLGDPYAFVEYVAAKYPDQQVHVCRHGEGFVVAKQES